MQQNSNEHTFHLSFKLINAWVVEREKQKDKHFFAVVHHKNINFRTPLCQASKGFIQFKDIRSFYIDFIPSERKQSPESFLRIVLNTVESDRKIQACFDTKMLGAMIDRFGKNLKKGDKKVKKIITLPLFGKGRSTEGEIKLGVSFFTGNLSEQNAKSSNFSSNISKFTINSDKKKVFSSPISNYFEPCVSKPIPTKIIQELQQKQTKHIKRLSKLDIKSIHSRNGSEQPFRQEISTIEMAESKICPESQRALQEQINQIQFRTQPVSPFEVQGKKQSKDKDLMEGIPQEYHHLFKKITEINEKYAPLQKIHSQEQISEEFTYTKKQSKNESFYSIDSNFDFETEPTQSPLTKAESFLKQLNLYKFAEKVRSQEQQKKEES